MWLRVKLLGHVPLTPCNNTPHHTATRSTPQHTATGSYDRFLNVMIILVIILQLILCFWQSIASVIFRNDNGMLRYYLALDNSAQGNPSNNFAYWIISFLTFWMLFSYLVPISLFVTMEIVKFMYVTSVLHASSYCQLLVKDASHHPHTTSHHPHTTLTPPSHMHRSLFPTHSHAPHSSHTQPGLYVYQL